MKIASWNVNSLRVRLEQLLRWLESERPDVVCLQETKVTDDLFPAAELSRAGYHAAFAGQKTYNGVAILARERPRAIVIGLPGDDDSAQKRLIAARVGEITVVNAYVPNGSAVGSEKYDDKLDWLDRLARALGERYDPGQPLVVCGDFNVAPEARDVHDPEALRGTIMFSEMEHEALERLLRWGLRDTLRLHAQEAGLYSWWDYRAGAFRRNLGWRIDLILATEPLARACTSASIDVEPRRWQRPSDHTPVLAVFEP
jgi:exodeoxyribonuclease-3